MFNAKWKSLLVLAAIAALPWASAAHALEIKSPDIFGKGPSGGGGAVVSPPKLDLEPGAPAPKFETRRDDSGLRLVFPYHGASHDLCRTPSGTILRRTRCRSDETSTDPSALHLCASGSGSISIRGSHCRNGQEFVDLRRVHRSSPSSFFPQLSKAAAFELVAPPPFDAEFPSDPSPATRPELCRTNQARVTLRPACRRNESPLHPGGLVACAKKSGAVVLGGLACPVGETAIDLADLRGAGPETIGIGPLVGLFPSLADLAADYPQGPGL